MSGVECATRFSARIEHEVLLLCDRPDRIAATVFHHIDALVKRSRHKVWPLSMLGDIPKALDLDRFDVIVVHYTLVACMESYMSAATRARLAASRAVKALFVQDEYRHVDRSIAAFRELGLDVLFTCVPDSELEKVYSEAKLPGVHKVSVLTGYVEESLLHCEVPPQRERPIDVGYRARKVPPWIGELGQEKWQIGKRFAADAAAYGLACDISYREEARLYGEAWIDFLTRCRAILGVESGASVFDFTGAVQAGVERDLIRRPNTDYQALRARHFGHLEGRIRLNQISPRCFEAAALRTLMILYEGEYSGRLEPWRHYLPLCKDHSNMAEIVSILRDTARCQEIVDRAYREVASAEENSYRALATRFDDALALAVARSGHAPARGMTQTEFARVTRPGWALRYRNWRRRLIGVMYHALFGGLLGWLSESQRDWVQLHLRQLVLVLLGRRGMH